MSDEKLSKAEINRQLLNGDYQTILQTNKASAFILAPLMIFGATLFLFLGRDARDVSMWPILIPITLTLGWVFFTVVSHHTTPDEEWKNMPQEQRAGWMIYHSKWGFLLTSGLFFHASFVIAWGMVEVALSRNLYWTAILFGSTYLFWILFCTFGSRLILRVALEGPDGHPVAYRLLYATLSLIGAFHMFQGFLIFISISTPTAADFLILPILLGLYILAMIAYPFALIHIWRARVQWKHWAKIKDGLDRR